jgi:hypothetical protein
MGRAFRVVGLGCAIAAVTLAGCGDEGSDVTCTGEPLALQAEKRVVVLSEGERAQLCDWSACQFGGYGAQPKCNGGMALTTAPTRGRCIGMTPTNPACQATVAEYARCIEALRASPCVETFLFGAECAAVTSIDCLVFTPNAMGIVRVREQSELPPDR